MTTGLGYFSCHWLFCFCTPPASSPRERGCFWFRVRAFIFFFFSFSPFARNINVSTHSFFFERDHLFYATGCTLYTTLKMVYVEHASISPIFRYPDWIIRMGLKMGSFMYVLLVPEFEPPNYFFFPFILLLKRVCATIQV